ncbi:allophanate hydrolase subunit 1 [Moritella sp. Urea-trap-13]|uniref:5-oxoprolinase subunit B family protein n=1 Tax=Moritella sp. Urea-trap-13 TaxID=2058327 RepID=UPI000C320451|nr:allophanate hydrolase subunit 1 [Moritella sp. Urea-trap-13]PKH07983.1 allophanate hydrolase subunit 1 [Moritella sp. Urea-trap-13]
MQYHLEMIGYDAILIRFTGADNAQLLPVIYNLNQQLTNAVDLETVITDVIPSYQTLLISFNIMLIEPHQLINKIHTYVKQVLQASLHKLPMAVDLLTLPVCYHQSLAPDLEPLSRHAALSIDDIIHIHSSTVYSCYAIGFMPNFGYLGDVDKRIQIPRHKAPKSHVAAGSVGIADNQTAIYPKASPGGWQIIGQSPLVLSRDNTVTLDSLVVGCQVKFKPISLDDFHQYQHTHQQEILL